MNWKNTENAIYNAVKSQQQQFKLKDTAEYPLAFNVDMPQAYAFSNGNISFKFADFVCSDFQDVQFISSQYTETDNRISIRLMLNKIAVKGQYVINAKMASKITMDTAGNMLDFEDERDLLQAAGSDLDGSVTPLTPEERAAFVDNAHDQETRLMDTPSGRKLMEVYREHDEIYNFVFNASPAARTSWYANGATAAMARDTDAALKTEGMVINSPTKKYGSKSYNANAIIQKLNIFTHTMMADPDFDISKADWEPNPESKYYKAANAALSFGKAVDINTNNNDKKITTLTSSQVYSHINSSNAAALPKVTLAEVMNVFSQANGTGGADEAEGNGWLVLDEQQRKLVRMWQVQAVQQRAMQPGNVTTTLWRGSCQADILNTTIDMELVIDPETKQFAVDKTSISLPAFEFDIDDSSWTGKAAELIRERISQLYFIKSLISRQIEQGIETIINQSVLTALQAS